MKRLKRNLLGLESIFVKSRICLGWVGLNYLNLATD